MKNKFLNSLVAVILLLSTVLCSCDFANLTGSVGVAKKQLVLPEKTSVFSRDLALDLFALDQCNQEKQTAASFTEYGFTVLEQHNYDLDLNDRSNTSGYTLGKGKVKIGNSEIEVYLLQIRATADHEWYSNIDIMHDEDDADNSRTISSSGYFNNFYETAENILEVLEEYIESKNDIFIITGYSRGAAVANVLCNQINLQCKVKPKIYGYTFACPYVYGAESLQQKNNVNLGFTKKYDGLFNVLAPGDIFTLLPVYSEPDYGVRFGTDIVLGDQDAFADDVKAFNSFLREFHYKGYDKETKHYNVITSYYDKPLYQYFRTSLLSTFTTDELYQGRLLKQWIQDILMSDNYFKTHQLERHQLAKYYHDNTTAFDIINDLTEQVVNSGNRNDDVVTKLSIWLDTSSSTILARIQKEAEVDEWFYGVNVKLIKPALDEYLSEDSKELDPVAIGAQLKEALGCNIVGLIYQHTPETYFDILSKAPETIKY